MPIDSYFNYEYGELPYRSIKFHHYTLPVPNILPSATVNFTHDEPYTRVTEWNKLPYKINQKSHTSLTIEEPCDYKDNNMERYYPIKDLDGQNTEKYKKYRSNVSDNVSFIGRCGLYTYLDMHQAISSALSIANKFIEKQSGELAP